MRSGYKYGHDIVSCNEQDQNSKLVMIRTKEQEWSYTLHINTPINTLQDRKVDDAYMMVNRLESKPLVPRLHGSFHSVGCH